MVTYDLQRFGRGKKVLKAYICHGIKPLCLCCQLRCSQEQECKIPALYFNCTCMLNCIHTSVTSM